MDNNFDINDLKRSLERRVEYEKIILEISSDMVNSSVAGLEEGITNALQKIGQHFGSSQGYIYLLSPNEDVFQLKNEWISDDYANGVVLPREIEADKYPWFMEELSKFEIVHITSTEDFPVKAEKERQLLKKVNATSLIFFPVVYNNSLIGIVGFFLQNTRNVLDDDSKNLFQLAVGFIVNAVVRKLAEDSLLEQIEFQQALIDAIPNPLYYKDIKGTYIACNRAFTEFIGVPIELLIGKNDYTISPKYLADLYKKSDDELLTKTEPQTFESYISARNGILRDVIFYKAPLKNEKGDACGIVGTFADISEQKWLEKKLKEQHERFIAVLDGFDFGVYVVDIESYEILFINRFIKDLTGHVVGSTCWEKLHIGQKGPCSFCTIGKLLEEKDNVDMVYKWERHEGGKWWLLSDRLIRWVDGRMAKLQFEMDITHIKEIEAALRESEELFKTLAENSFTGVGLYRENFIYSNPEMENIFDLNGEQLKQLDMTDKNIFDIFSDKSPGSNNRTYNKNYSDKNTVCIIETDKIKVKNGAEKWTKLYSTKVDYKGLPTTLVNIIDITDRINYEHQLQEQKKELQLLNEKLEKLNKNLAIEIEKEVEKSRRQEQLLIQQSKMASMGEMLASIAHQWRQPLNTLGLTIQDFQDAFEFGEMNTEYVNKVVDESMELIKYMSKTIDDFRNFFTPTKIKCAFNVINSLSEVISIISAQLKNSFIELEERFRKKDHIEIKGYPNEFKQVVLNIISNAKDAIVSKKKRKKMPYARVFVDVEDTPEDIKIIIGDNGGGIPEEIIPHIFDAYFTTKKEEGGSGIGLYMSKVIIENNMAGKLYANNVDDGAVFTIFLKK